MKRQLVNLIYYLIGIAVVFGIMIIPFSLYKKDDNQKYINRTFMEPITYGLSTDIRNIEAVRVIHRYLNSPYQIGVEYDGELSTQKRGDTSREQTTGKESRFETITKKREQDQVVLTYDKELKKAVEVLQQPENYSKKKYVNSMLWNTGEKLAKKRMNEYLKYLGLDVIDDWSFFVVIDGDEYEILEDQELLYEQYIGIRDRDDQTIEWMMYSEKAKLALMVTPEEKGIRYYFKVVY